MTDDRKLELERFFDGELVPDEQARVARELGVDPAAARYIEQLQQLRTLALRHDPSAMVSPARPAPPPWASPPTGRRWVMGAAGGLIAASILGLLWWSRGQEVGPPTRQAVAPPVVDPDAPSVVAPTDRTVASYAATVPLDLDEQLFEWANGALPSPAAAARALIDQAPRRRQRTPAGVEILTLELANSSEVSIQELGQVAVERTGQLRQHSARARGGRRPGHSSPTDPRRA